MATEQVFKDHLKTAKKWDDHLGFVPDAAKRNDGIKSFDGSILKL
jgi:hypothetical protein